MGATTYLMDSQALLFALTNARSLSTKARLLIAAQALVEGATLITADAAMQDFEPLSTVW